jgi:MinD-like ATPase involved in chromosome partitioning or flagellar assembly
VSAVTDTPDTVQHGDVAREDRGRLVAVAGLCGGAGASTLAYLTCCAAIADGQQPVLCIDATGRAGIAAYAGAHGALSFAHAAVELEAGRIPEPERLFVTSGDGVRVLSATPLLDQPLVAVDGAARLLGDARAAHALTVVDCGTLTSGYERLALGSAGHVVLVMPATRSGIQRAAALAAPAREL